MKITLIIKYNKLQINYIIAKQIAIKNIKKDSYGYLYLDNFDGCLFYNGISYC